MGAEAPTSSSNDVAISAVDASRFAPTNIAVAERARLDIDTRADGTVWVRGRDYKAKFGREGLTYIPFLGSDAPRNYPVDLSVEKVLVAGLELAFRADVSAIVEGSSIVFERGSFRERYLLTPDGVEQTFVFNELPARGEIVVEIGVETELVSRADTAGFRFENERGHVRYGRAFAFDADGDKQPIEARLAEREIRLVVPAARVAAAVFPLTIDPVLSTYNATNGGPSQFAADTAFDALNSVYFTVMEEIFSASDHDVRGVRHTEAGGGLDIRFIDTSDANWTQPKVANNRYHDQFLVVAAVGATPNRQIYGRSVSAGAEMAISSAVHVSSVTPNRDCSHPGVGGDSAPESDTRYCVVWQSDLAAGERAIDFRTLRAPDLGPGGVSWATFGGVHTNPAVSKSNGTGSQAERWWNLAYEVEVTGANHDIAWRRVSADGWGTIGGILETALVDERNPAPTAALDDAGPWMVAYQSRNAAGNWDVAASAFQHASLLDSLALASQFPLSGLDRVDPASDTDGRQFVLAYTERATPFYTISDIRLSSLVAVGGILRVNEGNMSAAPGLALDAAASIATRASGGSASDNALIVFDRGMSGSHDVFATVYDMPDGGPVVPFCFGDGSGGVCPCLNFGADGHGCANSANGAGALLGATGNAALGFDDSLTLNASGMPSSATCLFFQGTAHVAGGNGTAFGDGLRCAAGTVIRLATKTASGGSASYPEIGEQDISVRGLVPAAGATRYYQVRYRNNTSYCTPDTFNLTNGLRVTWLL